MPTRKVSDLDWVKTTRRAVATVGKYVLMVVCDDGGGSMDLRGLGLLITDDGLHEEASGDILVGRTNERYPAHEIYGEYALDKLIRDLPLETLQKYKVAAAKAPAPVPVRRKK